MKHAVDKQISNVVSEGAIKFFAFRSSFGEVNKNFTSLFVVGKWQNIGRLVFVSIRAVESLRAAATNKYEA